MRARPADHHDVARGRPVAPIVPYQVFLMMPFLLTIVGMALVSRNARAPAALLMPFRKEER